MIGRAVLRALALGALLVPAGSMAIAQDRSKDPHVVERPRDLREDREFVSPPRLLNPIFACATSVRVTGFVPHAKLMVFDSADPNNSIGGAEGLIEHPWQPVDVPAQTAGRVLFAIQVAPDGAKSGPSNSVTVTSHTDVYPAGIPQPVLQVPPPLACGAAIGVEPLIPSATVRIRAEAPTGPGTFAPPVEIGNLRDFPYAFVAAFTETHRITAQAEICTDKSPLSPDQTVAASPGSLPPPTVLPFTATADRLVVAGPGGPGTAPFQGARLEAFRGPPGSPPVGGQATPGTGPQQVLINPVAQAPPPDYTATQALCVRSPPSAPVGARPCSEIGAPVVREPVPGDTSIEVLDSEAGAEILVFINGAEEGHGGAPVVPLRPGVAVEEGDVVVVIQRHSPECEGRFAWETVVSCGRGGALGACSGDWPAYRQNPLRDGLQPVDSPLADPERARRLAVVRQFPPPDRPALRPFRAGPVVFRNRVFVGNGDGRLYALNATTMALLWQYPPEGDPPLTSAWAESGACANPSSSGLAASAAIADIEGRPVVIFGAPDRSIGAGLGSGRLFALDLNGNEVWKSREIAVLNGLTSGNTDQRHEQIGYSAPLVVQGRVYVGIANHCDNPIQQGRVAAVSVFDGSIVGGFDFRAVSTRGGGIWSALAGGLEGGIFATTGNTNRHDGASEPADNHGLSVVRLDPNTGALQWKLQPVPYAEDGDPDWASGPTLMRTRCGPLAASTMKDGWAYAAAAAAPLAVRWQFPNTLFPFFAGDPFAHGDTRYHRSGGAWRDTFVAMMGGHEVTTSVLAGYSRLHALDACAGEGGRVRWLVDVPGVGTVTDARQTTMSPPSIAGGVVYVGTDLGHLAVLADPAVWPSPGLVCVRPGLTIAQCQAQGLPVVPRPAVLADLALGQGSIIAEPALARGRVYVATTGGRVIMLAPP